MGISCAGALSYMGKEAETYVRFHNVGGSKAVSEDGFIG